MAAVVETAPPAPVATESVTRRETNQPERLANSIQVCLERSPAFYSRIGRRMLHGSTDGKPTYDEVSYSGLHFFRRCAG